MTSGRGAKTAPNTEPTHSKLLVLERQLLRVGQHPLDVVALRTRAGAAGAPTIAGARSLATTEAPSLAHTSAKLPSPAATSSTSCPADTAQASQSSRAAGSSTRESEL